MARARVRVCLALLVAGCGAPSATPELRVDAASVIDDAWAAGEAPSEHGGDANGAIDAGERVRLALVLSLGDAPLSADRGVTVAAEFDGTALASLGGTAGGSFELVVPEGASGTLALSVAAHGHSGPPARFAAPVNHVLPPSIAPGVGFPVGAVRPGQTYAITVDVTPPPGLGAAAFWVRVEAEAPFLAVQGDPRPEPGSISFELHVSANAPHGGSGCFLVIVGTTQADAPYAWRQPLCLTVAAPAGPDLVLYDERLRADIVLDERLFDADSCALQEGCVAGPGVRRLLRFDVSTANIGDGPLVVGRPADRPEEFVYSACHDHSHFSEFAQYSLERPDGSTAAQGHKQAFCLEDTDVYPQPGDPFVGGVQVYDCDFQGISAGWYDSYPSDLDCQWVDVTDVPAGAYRLRVRINPGGDLPESDLGNNELAVDVTLPALVDLSAPCPDPPDLFSDRSDPARNCGWTIGQVAPCDPGSVVRLGCAGSQAFGPGCQLGRCVGDPMLRVCAGQGAEAKCLRSMAAQEADNACRSFCPSARFVCPPEGVYTAWIAAKRADQQAATVCELQASTGSLLDLCEPEVSAGEDWAQTCGWRVRLQGVACEPGQRHRVGCESALGPDCVGDTLLRVCPGDGQCPPGGALGQASAVCPQADVTCPPGGRMTVLSALPGGGPLDPGACTPQIMPAP